jgi:hypothetical protein
MLWFEVSPKSPCVKGLATSLWYYWKVVGLLRGRRKLGHWGHALERDSGSPVTSCLPLCFLADIGENLPLSCTPALMYCGTTGPKETDPSNHGLKSLQLCVKKSFPSFKLIVSGVLSQ